MPPSPHRSSTAPPTSATSSTACAPPARSQRRRRMPPPSASTPDPVPEPPEAKPRATYDYALLRVVPRVERGEFVNVGAVLYCRTRRFLRAALAVDDARLLAL